MRELFVYYRVPLEQAARVEAQVHRLQQRLRGERPDLRARLLRRPEVDAAGQLTFMETYASDAPGGSGVDAALQAVIESAAAQQLEGVTGPRHVEVFVASLPA